MIGSIFLPIKQATVPRCTAWDEEDYHENILLDAL